MVAKNTGPLPAALEGLVTHLSSLKTRMECAALQATEAQGGCVSSSAALASLEARLDAATEADRRSTTQQSDRLVAVESEITSARKELERVSTDVMELRTLLESTGRSRRTTTNESIESRKDSKLTASLPPQRSDSKSSFSHMSSGMGSQPLQRPSSPRAAASSAYGVASQPLQRPSSPRGSKVPQRTRDFSAVLHARVLDERDGAAEESRCAEADQFEARVEQLVRKHVLEELIPFKERIASMQSHVDCILRHQDPHRKEEISLLTGAIAENSAVAAQSDGPIAAASSLVDHQRLQLPAEQASKLQAVIEQFSQRTTFVEDAARSLAKQFDVLHEEQTVSKRQMQEFRASTHTKLSKLSSAVKEFTDFHSSTPSSPSVDYRSLRPGVATVRESPDVSLATDVSSIDPTSSVTALPISTRRSVMTSPRSGLGGRASISGPPPRTKAPTYVPSSVRSVQR